MDPLGDDIKKSYSLREQDKEDPATKEWCKLIDLDAVIEPELDWHSTRTFELFLNALDVNQIVIKEDKKSNAKTDIRQTKRACHNNGVKDEIVIDTASQNVSSENQNISSSGTVKNTDTYQGVETILSAEALKILSELPDLSHMSTTRSFIFPTYKSARK